MSSITLRIPLQQYGYLEVTGENADEVALAAQEAFEERLFQTGIEIERAAVAVARIPGATVVETRTESAPAPAAPAQAAPPAAASGPSCEHGQRVHRTGTSAKGPWSAYFCPQPKGDPTACKPIWK